MKSLVQKAKWDTTPTFIGYLIGHLKITPVTCSKMRLEKFTVHAGFAA